MAKVSRRMMLAAGLAAAPAAGRAAPSGPQGDAGPVEAALRAFIAAFNACDLAAMEQAFAPDAQSFDRTYMTPRGTPEIRLDDYRRKPGVPPQMRRIAETLPRTTKGPPYQNIDPQDLMIQVSGEMALCTFHLVGEHSLGRRTIVMAKRPGGWKIIHLHASQVQDA